MGLFTGSVSGSKSGLKLGGDAQVISSIVAPQYAANQANLELSKYAYSRDLEMWNRQNEYNNPVNQMKRFAEAGLNPNLVVGQGSPGNATTMPKYNAPTIDYSQKIPMVTGMLQTFADLDMKKAGTDKIVEETRALKYNNEILETIQMDRALTELDVLKEKRDRGLITEMELYDKAREIGLKYNVRIDTWNGRAFDITELPGEIPSERKKEYELRKYNQEEILLDEKIRGQKQINDFFKAGKIIDFITKGIGMFR